MAAARAPVPSQEADMSIEVDATVNDDGASTIDEQMSSCTTSLAESVQKYQFEHGRRYHAYRAGAYAMPNDEPEQERLDMTHHVMVKGTGGRLYFAPLEEDKVKTILDVGTGTGIWAIEMSDKFPNAKILGNDLSPIQPSWIPENVSFEVDDVESPWTNNQPFDFIFSRYMAGSLLDWPKYIKTVYDNVSPGGWAEFQDYDGQYYTDDHTLSAEHNTQMWVNGLLEGAQRLGRDSRPGPKLEAWVKDAGFRNVVHRRFKLPIGAWPLNPELKAVGIINLAQVLEGLEAFSYRLYCNVLGWSEEEVVAFLSRVKSELKSGSIHCYVYFYVVYGQKAAAEGE